MLMEDEFDKFRDHSLDLWVAEVSRGPQVPGLENKVFGQADGATLYVPVTPINFLQFASVWQNKVVIWQIE